MQIARICLASLLVYSTFAADATWTHLQTENFEMYTTAGEKKGRETLLYYEQVRALFAKLFKFDKPSKFPVRIVAFRNEKEFLPFRPGQAAAAFYAPSLERDYIVMQSINPENYPVAVHEYTHRFIHSMGLEFPIWLNEGFAELFSTVQQAGNKIEMGKMDANRALVVRSNKTIPFATFMSIDEKSPLYNEREKASIFYAQSFALAHMLYFSETYKPKIGALETAYQKSKDPATVFQTAYGMPIEAVQKDLERYMRQDRFFYTIVDVKLEKSAETPESRPVDAYESTAIKADLYRVVKNWDESARLYQSLNEMDPKRPGGEEGLAWLAMYQNKNSEAAPHFVKAVELGSKSAAVCEHAAKLSWNDSKRALGYMKRALELDPDIADGTYNLGILALNANEPKTAVDAFNHIKKVTPDKASALFRFRAHALIGVKNWTEARENTKLAEKYAKTEEDRLGAQELTMYFDRLDHPQTLQMTPSEPPNATATVTDIAPARLPSRIREPRKSVTGDLRDVACQGKQARLTVVDAAGSKSVLLINDPNSVEIRNAEGVTHEFTCGPQKNTRVTIEFADPAIVRTIEFIK